MAAAIHPLPTDAPLDVRNTLVLECYAGRLARHGHRLEDELHEARQRITWRRHERSARRSLAPGEIRALNAVGILAADLTDQADRTTIQRRTEQLAALATLEHLTSDAIDRFDRAADMERRSKPT